jgi:hypothetical protein
VIPLEIQAPANTLGWRFPSEPADGELHPWERECGHTGPVWFQYRGGQVDGGHMLLDVYCLDCRKAAHATQPMGMRGLGSAGWICRVVRVEGRTG